MKKALDTPRRRLWDVSEELTGVTYEPLARKPEPARAGRRSRLGRLSRSGGGRRPR